ncbi:MAG TPA: MFS transporter [Flavobacteriales bacterium]|nr:MFS transporter [Flavobacteriales bacterium]
MNRKTLLLIIVASLGYFVDIYDLVLFNVIKAESLKQIMPDATPDEIKNTGLFLFNMQMTGMLIGGLLWGIWGDKKGRLTVLFGSILLYSTANIVNAFTFNIPFYAVVRVIAGIGLAGELGAGITMVSEMMSKENRGWGTMIIVTFGALGAVVAFLVSENGAAMGHWFSNIIGTELASWQVSYIFGGTMGLVLLLLRVGTIESKMFANATHAHVKRGNIGILFTRKNFPKYVKCILIGVPIWYMIGLLIANSEPIFSKEIGVEGVKNGRAVMYTYLGLSAGDLLSGVLSQLLKSRKKVVVIYIILSIITTGFFLFCKGISLGQFYFLCFMMGAATGYWAIFVTIATEQFGTNIRSTVTNTVPNFVRGSVPLITGLFGLLTASSVSNVTSAILVGILCMGAALWAILTSTETFAKDLDYLEE